MVKNPPAMWETWVWFLDWEDLEKRMATHSSILAWEISWTEEPGSLRSMGSQRAGHDWTTNIFIFTFKLLLSSPGYPSKRIFRNWPHVCPLPAMIRVWISGVLLTGSAYEPGSQKGLSLNPGPATKQLQSLVKSCNFLKSVSSSVKCMW